MRDGLSRPARANTRRRPRAAAERRVIMGQLAEKYVRLRTSVGGMREKTEFEFTFGMPEEDFGYAVRKDDAELLAKVNASLKKLMADPEWQRLIDKYELRK